MKRKPITEDDKLKEAKCQAKRISKFLDEELARWEEGNIDREMLCAGMETWISAHREIFRIQNDKQLHELKWKREISSEE